MKINITILVASAVIPMLSIFLAPIEYYSGRKCGLGLPLKFLLYYSFNFPSNRIEMFKLDNLTKITFRMEVYFICIVIVYFVLYLTYRIISKARSGSFSGIFQTR
jgi:uncharacterized membrane protein YvlD (DUF360 family)